LRDARVVCSVDSLPFCACARVRDGCRLPLVRRRVEPPPLARRLVPEPLLLARERVPEPLLLARERVPEPLLLARERVPEPLLLARLLGPEPLLLARRVVPELPLARFLLPAPLPAPSLGEAFALELRDAPVMGCLPRLRRVDALERSDALDPFDEDDDERLRLLVLPDVPRSAAAAMVTS
jgi:hypothetical protein